MPADDHADTTQTMRQRRLLLPVPQIDRWMQFTYQREGLKSLSAWACWRFEHIWLVKPSPGDLYQRSRNRPGHSGSKLMMALPVCGTVCLMTPALRIRRKMAAILALDIPDQRTGNRAAAKA